MSQPSIDEHEILATRAIAIVLALLTVLFTFLWIVTGAAPIQAAALLTGLVTVMTWLSYGQQKTDAAIEKLTQSFKRH